MMADKFIKGPFEPDDNLHAVPAAVEEEFMLLMSLALDDMLDGEEERQFQEYRITYPALADEWQRWRELDSELQSTPSALPPAGFVEMFELALLYRERRRRLLWGVGIGVVVVLLWLGVMAGAMSLGAFVMFGQSAWLTELMRSIAQLSATMNNGLLIATNALASVFGTEQARMFILIYTTTAALMLTGWVFLLRRTTRLGEATLTVHS